MTHSFINISLSQSVAECGSGVAVQSVAVEWQCRVWRWNGSAECGGGMAVQSVAVDEYPPPYPVTHQNDEA